MAEESCGWKRSWQQPSTINLSLTSLLIKLNQALAQIHAAQIRINLSRLNEEISLIKRRIAAKKKELAGWRELEENDRLKGIISPLTSEAIEEGEKVLAALSGRLADLQSERDEIAAQQSPHAPN